LAPLLVLQIRLLITRPPLLTDAALAAFLGAMLAIVAVFTGVAGVGAGAGCGQRI
jgi:hypothetical protein